MEQWLQHSILQQLKDAVGSSISAVTVAAIGGGCINSTWRVETNTNNTFFCKINSTKDLPGLFICEQRGLQLLARQQVIRVPEVVACYEEGSYQVLILSWIREGRNTGRSWKLLGQQLAALHAVSSNAFGLQEDNYMGALVQHNAPMNNWCDFFMHRRLIPQVEMALSKNLLLPEHVRRLEQLYGKLPEIFPPASPALVHGDLWSGNYLCDDQGNPVLVDPAVYYGHNSVDLAMTTLFGGFDDLFYEAYHYHRPFPANYRQQWEVANLYPLLIHLNLFGQSYLPDILHTLRRY